MPAHSKTEAGKGSDDGNGEDARIDARQVRSFVERARARSNDLISAGVDSARFPDKLSRIEECVDDSDHQPSKLRLLLTELEADLAEIESKLVATGLLPELHLILGTGVPVPR